MPLVAVALDPFSLINWYSSKESYWIGILESRPDGSIQVNFNDGIEMKNYTLTTGKKKDRNSQE